MRSALSKVSRSTSTMTTSDSAGSPSATAPAVSGPGIGSGRQRASAGSPLASTAGVAPAQALSLAGWDLSTLDAGHDGRGQGSERASLSRGQGRGDTTLSPSSGSEPAIVAGTPGVSHPLRPPRATYPRRCPVCLPRQQHRPARAPSTRLPWPNPVQTSFAFLLGEPPRWRTSYFLVQTGPNPDSPSDIFAGGDQGSHRLCPRR